ncbi:MAG: TlpA family protein disulfide reductase [Rikenellaceae bacterium]|jgi:thiol-disulfide isomerase/thioredoxin|nr:TlpA family protein disulfide reductase [Rikenellaceae bacterium]MBQ5372430.1 TlpA family protein disulfide reductase [Rikenellaceae bacterium]MBQ5596245.1 TlpA family protein disulfide reductase [Rikenellaceae bacterium]MBQ5679266.1 TlpA family protein disulfide reductase [Rikenellaceae bacterium]MBQ5852986.1 TlpA family protein disulfide reductase [Rikenellaceae bacterium]
MKRTIFLTLVALVASLAVRAQEIVIGERVPDFRPTEWLGAQPSEDDRRATLLVFYHTESQPCVETLPHIDSLARAMKNERVIVVAMEPKERIAPSLARYMSERFYVAIDLSERVFKSYGIRYVPFGVLVDPKGRAQWIGNPKLATSESIKRNLK